MFAFDVQFLMAAIHVILLSALVLTSCQQMFDNDPTDEDDVTSEWRDPTNMIDYNLATGEMRSTEVGTVSDC